MTSSKQIFLTGSDTWEDWNERCLSHAEMYDLLAHLQGREELLPKPIKPSTSDYPQKTRPAIGSSSQSIAEGDETPSTLTSTSLAYGNLSADGQKAFSMAWAFYQDELKAYKSQRDQVIKLKEWIIANVSSHFQKTCCKSSQTIPQWYGNLLSAAGISQRQQDANARRKYQEALKVPKPKDLRAWTDKWEQAMTEARQRNVDATRRPAVWFEDFLNTVKEIDPMWVKAYGISKDPKVDDETLDFHSVANDLRKEAKEVDLSKSGRRIAKGAFGPTFGGEENPYGRSEESPEADEDKKPRKGKDRRPRQGKGKQEDENQSDAGPKRKVTTGDAATAATRRVCRACEGVHYTSHCFYLFPNRAPEGWIPRPDLKKLTKNNLETDSTLKDEYQRWTKKKDDTRNEKDE
jgi:hypothetical protein